MIPYVVCVFIIIAAYVIVYNSSISYQAKIKVYVWICAVMLILLSALRGSTVGTDTAGYVRDYKAIHSYSFKDIFDLHSTNYGYYLLSKIFASIGAPVQLWLGFVATLYIGAISNLIYKYSIAPLTSYIIFLSVGGFAFSLAGLKQTIAMSFLLFAYPKLVKRKFIPFLLLVLVASLFHSTALVFLISYPLSKINVTTKQFCVYLGLIAFSFTNAGVVLNTVFDLLDDKHYSAYQTADSTYSLTGFLIQLFMLIFCLLYADKFKSLNVHYRSLYTMLYLGVLSQVYASSIASLFRISLYFSGFCIILFPYCICLEENEGRKRYIHIISLFIFLAYFFFKLLKDNSISPYLFFWQ